MRYTTRHNVGELVELLVEQDIGDIDYGGKRKLRDMSIEELRAELRRHRQSTRDFLDDPMTQYYGVADDFMPDFDVKERRIIVQLLRKAQELGDEDVIQYALEELEPFLP